MSTERDIGELKEHARWTRQVIEKMDRKIDVLIGFRWKVLGGAAVVAALASLAFELLIRR